MALFFATQGPLLHGGFFRRPLDRATQHAMAVFSDFLKLLWNHNNPEQPEPIHSEMVVPPNVQEEAEQQEQRREEAAVEVQERAL